MSKAEKIKDEIDRLQSSTLDENSNFKSQYDQGIFDGLSIIDNFIDSLEVKEVDLEKEIEDAFLENKCNITDNVSLVEFVRIANYFFELGLKAKGE